VKKEESKKALSLTRIADILLQLYENEISGLLPHYSSGQNPF